MHKQTRPHYHSLLLPAARRTVCSDACVPNKYLLIALWSYSILLIAGSAAIAQVTPGAPSFSAYDSHEVDTVNLMNNNIMINVPIRSKAGAIPLNIQGTANSYMYVNGASIWTSSMQAYAGIYSGAPFLPFANNVLSTQVVVGFTGSLVTCSGYPANKSTNWYIETGDGTIHWLPSSDYTLYGSGSGCITSISDQTIDGSGFTLSVTGSTVNSVHDKSGTSIPHPGTGSSVIADSNGNSITLAGGNSWIDSLGLTALSTTGGTNPTYSWTDVNSGSPGVSQSTTTWPMRTAFGCVGVNELTGAPSPFTTNMSFADNTSLAFTYEGTPGYPGSYTGRIQQITLREGGTVAYTYGGANNGIDCTYLTVPVLTRTLGNGDTMTYTLTHPIIGSGPNYQSVNTVVDPGANNTVYTFTGFTSAGTSTASLQLLTQVQRYQGSGTLLSTDLYCYNGVTANCATATYATARITEVDVYHTLSGMSTSVRRQTKFDNYGNVTYLAQYDFGGASAVKTTTITYGSCSANCKTSGPTISAIGSYINDRPGEVVMTQNGSTVAQTNYTYDAHGNLLSTAVWNGSSFIGQTTNNSYNSNGTPSKTYDAANNETDYAYVAGSYVGCSGCTQYPFPTQVKNVGTGDYVNTVWYGVGGMKSSDTDRNGNTVTYCYNTGSSCSGGTADPYWRVLQTIDPYGSTVLSTYPTGSTPGTTSTSFTFNSSNSINSTTITTDGYGRTINSQTAQSPSGSNYDTVTTAYGWATNYQTIATSQPCSTTTGGTCTTVHTAEYDSLGRLISSTTTSNETLTHTYTQNDDLAGLTPAPSGENGKQIQTQYDGLGRVQYVCRIGSTVSTGSTTACGQNTGSLNGATDAYTYTQGTGYTEVQVMRNGGQPRTNYYDALGRLYQRSTPEGGTWSYYFDSYSSCPTGYKGANGQLTAIKDPNGNLLCYSYDALNRVTGVNANGTSCRHYYYDNSAGYSGTLPTGITLANQYGRVVEAATDSCSSGTLITDEWFAYDPDGRVADIWQSTPHSMQYYHSHATFFENGAIKTLQLASPPLYTLTYGLDGEGRWNTLADASQNIVTATTFVPAGNTATITYTGSTPDNDSYTFDSHTGRMNQFEFTVGSTPASLTGVLHWNPNGTLGETDTTDGFNPGNSYNCYSNSSGFLGSGYDDWGRLIEFDCGSGNWGQQFGYDIYDNLSKTVLSGRTGTTWNPGYSSSNNACTGCTYDSNGDVLGDGNYVYTWNEFSKLKSATTSGTVTCGTNGRCPVYDAFGRMVESSSGSTWTEWWITQGGTENMSGTTGNFGSFPTPGGNTAIVSGSIYVLHNDWLGSARLAHVVSTRNVYVDRGFTPYGEMYSNYGSGSGQSRLDLFAGTTDNLDRGVIYDTPNRELSIAGRWLSPDPAAVGWNQYAYPTNPNSSVDPTGLGPIPVTCKVSSGCSGNYGSDPGVDEGGSPAIGTDGQNLGQVDGPNGSLNLVLTSDGLMWTNPYNGSPVDPDSALELGISLSDLGLGLLSQTSQPGDDGSALSPTAKRCLDKVQNAAQNTLGQPANYISPTQGPGLDSNGFRNGAYNFDFFAAGYTGTGLGTFCGRYAPPGIIGTITGIGPSLHIVAPPGACNPTGDPTSYAMSPAGLTFTAHIDSAFGYNPIGFIWHEIVDVLLKRNHGC